MHIAHPDATLPDSRVLAAVLRRLLRGERVSPASLSMGTGLTPAETEAALARLAEAGALYLADGTVVAAYPLSGIPTRHRLSLSGAIAYANCAVDALAIPPMVDEPVDIDSECGECGTAISVRMSGERIVAAQPESTVVFYLRFGDCCETGPAVLTRCPHINFFCEPDHAARWQAAHPERSGSALSLARAAVRARERFSPVIRAFRGGTVPLEELSRSVQWPRREERE